MRLDLVNLGYRNHELVAVFEHHGKPAVAVAEIAVDGQPQAQLEVACFEQFAAAVVDAAVVVAVVVVAVAVAAAVGVAVAVAVAGEPQLVLGPFPVAALQVEGILHRRVPDRGLGQSGLDSEEGGDSNTVA